MFGWRKRMSADFSNEIAAHIALEAERLHGQGLSEAEATAAARRNFGNLLGANELFYESSRWMWLDHIRQDLRYAARQKQLYRLGETLQCLRDRRLSGRTSACIPAIPSKTPSCLLNESRRVVWHCAAWSQMT